MNTIELSVLDVLKCNVSRNVIYKSDDFIIRIGDIASCIITSILVNNIQGLVAPKFDVIDLKLLNQDGSAHTLRAVLTKDVFKNTVNLRFLQNFLEEKYNDLDSYVQNISSLTEKYLGVDMTDTIVKRAYLAYLTSSLIPYVDNINFVADEHGICDIGLVLDVEFGYNINENGRKSFSKEDITRSYCMSFFERTKKPLIIDYDKLLSDWDSVDRLEWSTQDNMRFEYITYVTKMIMKECEGMVWIRK